MSDGREMIVGAEGHDYDQLMNVGAEQGPQRHYGPPQGYPQQGYPQYPQYPQGYPQQFGPPPPYMPAQPPPQAAPQRHVHREQITRSRDFPIGFTSPPIPPGDPVEIEVKPQVLFKGKRLAVATSIAKEFMIIDIKVGKNSQLAATGEMTAEAFSADAVGTQMELDTASPGITITLRVRNVGTQPFPFRAVLYGAVLE